MNIRLRLAYLRYELGKRREKALMAIAWKLPQPLAYWTAIRVMANATTGEYSDQVVPELTAIEALERWPRQRRGGVRA